MPAAPAALSAFEDSVTKSDGAMAEEAQQAWKRIKIITSGQAWIRFARTDATAAQNAARGQRGEHVRRESVD